MVTTTKTKEWYLRYPLEDPMHKTALCEIKDEKDFLPENSSVFQPVTARVAAALSMSAADETLLKENLRALGFGDIVTLAYGEGDRDKIGMCIASRVTGEQLQIAVVLRGTCGEEWYSNFEIGYSAEHSGFARAADFAELRLADYVFTRAICIQPRFFITGYSRGGAVANILAKRLCDRYGLDYVSAYTFAAPATVSRSSVWWFDDQPWGGCSVPKAWRILFKNAAGTWVPVTGAAGYPTVKGNASTVDFDPVTTTALRLEVDLPDELSAGLYEWEVK